ncbi:MAG TPA: hypothetical protein VJB98_02700 [Candidatus Paceibacterota bacterium]
MKVSVGKLTSRDFIVARAVAALDVALYTRVVDWKGINRGITYKVYYHGRAYSDMATVHVSPVSWPKEERLSLNFHRSATGNTWGEDWCLTELFWYPPSIKPLHLQFDWGGRRLMTNGNHPIESKILERDGGQVRLDGSDVVFFSSTGETARLNLLHLIRPS